jgi:hypothetical protein
VDFEVILVPHGPVTNSETFGPTARPANHGGELSIMAICHLSDDFAARATSLEASVLRRI